MRTLLTCAIVFVALMTGYLVAPHLGNVSERLPGPPRDIAEIRERVTPTLRQSMGEVGLELGSAAFIRIFKEESVLEVWIEKGTRYALFRTYPICNYSGHLGPKLREGDHQSPEGFYKVDATAMNPNSSYHLSFNLGFPNAYDQANSRTGSYLMIHGDCVSVGCYARGLMPDGAESYAKAVRKGIV